MNGNFRNDSLDLLDSIKQGLIRLRSTFEKAETTAIKSKSAKSDRADRSLAVAGLQKKVPRSAAGG